MSLTEKQRAAIEMAISLYDDRIRYLIKGKYGNCLIKGFKKYQAVLQAMIDGSGTVEPTGGFDLEGAWAICNHCCAPFSEVTDEHVSHAMRCFYKSLAEIERLRAEISEQKGIIWKTQQVEKEQAARIKELENALVEERVIGEGGFRAEQCEFWYIEDLPEESCMELDGLCDWAKCPRKHELCDVAYQQLAEEGKIGPDDSKKISHLRPYEVVAADLAGMLAKSWQITDERKAAIQWAKEMAGDCKAGDVLRGMLAEVTR